MSHHQPLPPRLRRLVALALVVALSPAAAACSDGGDEPEAGEPAATGTAPSTTAPAGDTSPPEEAEEEPAPARLIAERSGGRVSCVADTARGELVTLYDSIAQASGDLTITRVRASGRGVRLTGAEGVLVTAKPAWGPGVSIGDRWPIPADPMLRDKADLSSRQELRDMELADGDRVLPLVALRVAPGAVLEGLVVTYRDAQGAASEVNLPLHTRFAPGRCPGI